MKKILTMEEGPKKKFSLKGLAEAWDLDSLEDSASVKEPDWGFGSVKKPDLHHENTTLGGLHVTHEHKQDTSIADGAFDSIYNNYFNFFPPPPTHDDGFLGSGTKRKIDQMMDDDVSVNTLKEEESNLDAKGWPDAKGKGLLFDLNLNPYPDANEWRYTTEEKGKGVLYDVIEISEDDEKLNAHPWRTTKGYAQEEAIKVETMSSNYMDLDLGSDTEDDLVDIAVEGLHPFEDNVEMQNPFYDNVERQPRNRRVGNVRPERRDYWGRFKEVAKERAANFAYFQSIDGEANGAADAESGEELLDADLGIVDGETAFSKAMKTIRDRTIKPNAKPMINWVPSKDPEQKRVVPSLQDKCIDVLAKNADAIVSLDNIPDEFRNKLSQLLCNSRKMDIHFINLLASGSPTEIRVTDCSWMTEEQMTDILTGCDMKELKVLQLDLCGRCMPDYTLRSIFAQLSNKLTALVAISLRGASRLTDSGLSSLVASTPALRSINLCQCSLITSTGINTIVDSLGSIVKELYLDDCQNVDAMLILPALKKLKHLEVLSVAGIETVCDVFVCELVAECGANVKELVLAKCKKLTDASMKGIGESCSGLLALDLSNLNKLTHSSLCDLANGCQYIQRLKLSTISFSDKAVAGFVEASGHSLTQLSLNNVKKVGSHTALSLARCCSRNLIDLDLSWCRNMSDEELGLIVESCSSLRALKLFGCTQITNRFVEEHSNPLVQIIGLKMSPLLGHQNRVDPQRAPLRYSSVPFVET